MEWLRFEGSDGINVLLDRERNNRHRGDDLLVPFRTKTDKDSYEDFAGVTGAFWRLLVGRFNKGRNLTEEEIKEGIRTRTDCSEANLERLYHLIRKMYFDEGKLVPINVHSLCLIESNLTQRQTADFLYSLFIESSDLKEKYCRMKDSENVNVFEKSLLFEIFAGKQTEEKRTTQRAECYLPYVRDVFQKDFQRLIQNPDMFKSLYSSFPGILLYVLYHTTGREAVEI